METSTTKPKRQTQKKTSLKSEDFTKLSFTELIEKAQWHRKQLEEIEAFLQEGVTKVMPLPPKNVMRNPVEPPFAQGYSTPALVAASIPTGDITFSTGISKPLPDMSALSQINTGELVVRRIEPQAEVYEVVGEEDTLAEINKLLNNSDTEVE